MNTSEVALVRIVIVRIHTNVQMVHTGSLRKCAVFDVRLLKDCANSRLVQTVRSTDVCMFVMF